MNPVYLGIGIGIGVSVMLAAGLWLRRPLRDYLLARRHEAETRRIFEETNRQLQLERVNQRRGLYLNFRNAAAGLVEELADGGGRWGGFYLTRDLLRELNARASPEVAMAARQMCFVCQVMLNEGFSDELSVRFDQSAHRYDEACREDLTRELSAPAWPLPVNPLDPAAALESEASARNSGGPRRRTFQVLR